MTNAAGGANENFKVFLLPKEQLLKLVSNVQRAIASLEEEKLITVENRKMMLSHEQYLNVIEII